MKYILLRLILFNFLIINLSFSQNKISDIDYSSIDNLDLDADGVNDDADACLSTPKGVKVDAKGCPVDSDGDGVPDYLDKEKGTKKGSLVDTDGKTVTDEMILAKSKQDSVGLVRSADFTKTPSAEALKKTDSDIQKNQKNKSTSSKVPPLFASADTNNDGTIASSEITGVIGGFFDGTNDYTVEKIHSLINYFFEQ